MDYTHLFEVLKFVISSDLLKNILYGVVGNLTYKSLEPILSESKRKIIAIFTKRGQKEKYNELSELVKSGNEKEFIKFLNSLDDDLRDSLIEILKEVNKRAVELNINIKEINSSVENIGRDKKVINNYGRYAEGDYFENVNGDVVKGNKNVYINEKKT